MIDSITGTRCAHICVDMQAMFATETEWHAPWLVNVLPAVEAIVAQRPARTVFTRFIPPQTPEQAHGAWKSYYDRWRSMTRDRLSPDLIELVPALRRFVPPALVMDKAIYSPWLGTELHAYLRNHAIDTLVVSGGETDVCVLATVLGAIDLGYHVVLPEDAIFGSADQTHDAMLSIYNSRFGQQLTVCTTQDLLDDWREQAA